MSRWFGVNCYLAEEARSRTSTSAMIAAKTTRCMADTLLPFALCQAHGWLGSRARSLYLYPAHPTTLYWPAWRVPGTVRASRRPGARFEGAVSRGHGGNSAALGVEQGDAIRNITGGAGYIQFHQNTGSAAGAFYLSGNGSRARINGSEYEPYLNFDASRVVPTAPETVR